MVRRFRGKRNRKIKIQISPKDADKIIEQEFTTENSNRIRKEFIFRPHSPNDSTIQFNVKGNRKEIE